jgi:tRNA1(Val) A37 N6-methylase TrmN6
MNANSIIADQVKLSEVPVGCDTPTTCDAFLGGAVHVHQPAKGYRAGLDAVLLAASVSEPESGDKVRLLDVGAGVGTVGLCAAARLADIDVTLVERSPDLCRIGERNIVENRLAGRVEIVEQDIAVAATHALLGDNSFDVVVANPPFYHDGRHRRSPHVLKAESHAMPPAGLDTWLRYMARKSKSGGVAIMVHRADHLPAMLEAFSPRFGGLTVLPLYPRQGEAASRVLLRGIKSSRAPLSILPGLCLHGPGNCFTAELDAVLKSPGPLRW